MKAFQFPLIKITVFFIFGILFAYYFQLELKLLFTILIFSLAILAFLLWKSFRAQFFGNWFDVLACFLAIIIGLSTQLIHNNLLNKNNYSHFINDVKKQYQIEVCLQEKLKFSKYNDRFIATINKGDQVVATGKIIVNIRKDSLKIFNFQPVTIYRNRSLEHSMPKSKIIYFLE